MENEQPHYRWSLYFKPVERKLWSLLTMCCFLYENIWKQVSCCTWALWRYCQDRSHSAINTLHSWTIHCLIVVEIFFFSHNQAELQNVLDTAHRMREKTRFLSACLRNNVFYYLSSIYFWLRQDNSLHRIQFSVGFVTQNAGNLSVCIISP